MDKANEFYGIAEENDIDILNFPLPLTGCLSIEVNGHCCIGLDSTRRFTRAEEAVRIGHELGHCLYGGFYTRSTPRDVKEKQEARADRWSSTQSQRIS